MGDEVRAAMDDAVADGGDRVGEALLDGGECVLLVGDGGVGLIERIALGVLDFKSGLGLADFCGAAGDEDGLGVVGVEAELEGG